MFKKTALFWKGGIPKVESSDQTHAVFKSIWRLTLKWLRYIIITWSLTMGAWIGSSQYPQIISHHLRLSPAIIGYLVICYPPRLADIWLRWYGQPMKTALFSPDNEVCSGRGHKFGPIFGTGSCMMCWMRSNIKSNTHDWFALMCYSMCFVSKYVKNQYRNIWLYDYIRTKNNHLKKCDESLRSVSVVLTILGNCIYWRPQHWRLVANSEVVNQN